MPVNSQLVQIPLSATGGLNKFIRPTFGDALVYVTDFNSNIICLGAPVALPLQCSTPVDFGNVNIGSTATQNVTCTALIAITSIDGCNTGKNYDFPALLLKLFKSRFSRHKFGHLPAFVPRKNVSEICLVEICDNFHAIMLMTIQATTDGNARTRHCQWAL